MVKAVALVWTRNIARICPFLTAYAISTVPSCEDIQYHLENALKKSYFFRIDSLTRKWGAGVPKLPKCELKILFSTLKADLFVEK